MEKLRNLDEQIYLMTYGKPMYKLEISMKLYGKEKKQILPEFQNEKNRN